MFIDKRGSPDVRATGNKVVICCEGNAAYYELGMMEIPLFREFLGTADTVRVVFQSVYHRGM